MKEIFVKSLLLFSGLVIGLFTAEIALRIQYYHSYAAKRKLHVQAVGCMQRSAIPSVPFMLKPNSGEINSFGRYTFRSPSVNDPKPKGTFRIVVIGDSMVFGYGIKSEETFSRILESSLNKVAGKTGYSSFEVVDMGVPLYDIFIESALVKDIARSRLNPDLIILGYFGSNDLIKSSWEFNGNTEVLTAFFHRVHSLEVLNVFPFLPLKIKNILINNSYLYEKLFSARESLIKKLFPKTDFKMELVSRQIGEEALLDMIRATRDNKIDFLILNLPWSRYDMEQSWDRENEDWMGKMQEKYLFHYLDIRPVFKAEKPQKLVCEETDNCHPGKYGHELIAQALYQYLMNEGLLINSRKSHN